MATSEIETLESRALPQLIEFPGVAGCRVSEPDHLLHLLDDLPCMVCDASGTPDLIATTSKLLELVRKFFPSTPQYRYELLDQALPYRVFLKHENLQHMGDTSVRAYASMILLNFLVQSGANGHVKTEFPERVVLSVDKENYSTGRFLQEIVFVARHMKIDVEIHASLDGLSLYVLHQLYNCVKVDATIKWHTEGCLDAAHRAAVESGSVFIDPRYDREHALIGIGTIAQEMLIDRPDLSSIVVPIRHYSTGWSTLAGVALYCGVVSRLRAQAREAALKAGASEKELAEMPGPIEVVAAQLVSDLKFQLPDGTLRKRQALFHDVSGRLWLTNRLASAAEECVFEEWDADGDGELTRNEILAVLRQLDAPIEKYAEASLELEEGEERTDDDLLPFVPWLCSSDVPYDSDTVGGTPGISRPPTSRAPIDRSASSPDENMPLALILSSFRHQLTEERGRLDWTARQAMGRFHSAVGLSSLKFYGLVCQVVPVNEDETARAFLVALQFTHTHVSGRGAASVAAALSGRVHARENTSQCVGVLVSGGTVDPQNLDTVLGLALDNSGLIRSFAVTAPNDANVLASLLGYVNDAGCSVYKVNAGATAGTNDNVPLDHVVIRLSVLAGGVDQMLDLQARILNHGWDLSPKISKKDEARLRGWRGCETGGSSKNLPALKLDPIEVKYSEEAAKACGVYKADNQVDSTPQPCKDGVKGQFEYHSCLKGLMDITPESVEEAYHRLSQTGTILKTPIYQSQGYSRVCGCEVYLMLENMQKTGSFKIRGSSNMLLKAIESGQRPPGVIACSAGNHAQGVAMTCARLGIPCAIVCPSYAPMTKLANTQRYGAEVLARGDSFEESTAYARKLCDERGWLFVHPYAALDVIEGQGTIAHELVQEVPDVDTVIVNVGGGGLISGIALYLKKLRARCGKKVRIIGVQAEPVSPLIGSEKTGQLRYIPPTAQTIADGVNVKVPGSSIHDEVLFSLIDEYVAVPENEIAATITHVLLKTRTLTEGAGCLGIAALLYGRIKVRPEEKVAVVLCGGNLDIPRLRQITEFGFRALGRALSIEVDVTDQRGMLLKLVDAAAQNTLSVRNVHHARASGLIPWTDVCVQLDLWTNGFSSQNRFLKQLVTENGLMPRVVGRRAIPHDTHAYSMFDQAVLKSTKKLAVSCTQRREAFAAVEAKRQQNRVSAGVTLSGVGETRPLMGTGE